MSCEQREGLQSDERYLFTEVLGALVPFAADQPGICI
jgi:hypothetical protein